MRVLTILTAIFALAAAAPASAHVGIAGSAVSHGASALTYTAHTGCAAGTATQRVTVVNQAGVTARVLARVERATTDQSMQIAAAWGTPCVTFGSGGWTVTLTASAPVQNADGSTSAAIHGEHCGPLGHVPTSCYSATPSATVDTSGTDVSVWPRALTHEIAEMLGDPTCGVTWTFGLREIADPVENQTYTLDGITVSDFAFPSYFNGGAAPYDQTGALTGAAYGVS